MDKEDTVLPYIYFEVSYKMEQRDCFHLDTLNYMFRKKGIGGIKYNKHTRDTFLFLYKII